MAPLLDHIIGTGIATDEGAQFDIFNQIIALLTANRLVGLAISGPSLADDWRIPARQRRGNLTIRSRLVVRLEKTDVRSSLRIE